MGLLRLLGSPFFVVLSSSNVIHLTAFSRRQSKVSRKKNGSKMSLEWHDHLQVDGAQIDKQHQQLFALCERLPT